MRLPQFRVWMLMVAVAAVALILGCPAAWRASRLASRAAAYRQMAKGSRSMASGFRRQASASGVDAQVAADFAREVEELDEVARIYERAADRPWLPVEFRPPARTGLPVAPDPPPPPPD